MDYKAYEEECEKIRKQNAEYLKVFEEDLTAAGLAKKTIRNHIDNVEFYINEYLLYDEADTMDEGVNRLDGFLGHFFIRKCMWSTPATIKSTAASIKKFYKCMLAHGNIEKEDYQYLCDEIKEGMPEWQEECAIYNGDYDEF